MKLECIFLVFVFFTSAVARKDGVNSAVWNPIEDINDPHVTEVAKFAVTAYDKQSGEKLELEKVIKGDTMVVTGIDYRLTLTATNGSSSNSYETIVWEKPWIHFKSLLSFTPVHA